MTTSHDFDATSRTVATPKGTLHYHEAGSGPPLLMLHGSGPGVTGWANFSGNLPVFAEHYRCLVLDLPGYGRSDAFEGHPIQSAVEAVVAFLDALGIDRTHVIGNSFGGIVGALLAAHHAGRVDRFVTIGGIGYGIFSAFPGEGINLLVAFIADPTRERLVQWLNSMVYDPAVLTDAMIDGRLAQALEPKTMETSRKFYSKPAIAAIAAMARGPNAVQGFAHLPMIQAPTLLTWGRDDRVTPLDQGLIAMRLIPNCEFHVFPKCGHWSMIERKVEFESLVQGFLNRGETRHS